MRNFISISIQTLNNVPCYIGTSTERFLLSQTEITSKQSVSFLQSLHSLARRKENKGAIFIWYDAHNSIELLLKDLPKKVKDILFPSPESERKRKQLRATIHSYDKYRKGKVVTARLAELRERLHKLEYAYWRGFRLRCKESKSLTIYKTTEDGKAKKGLTIFDISHFFNRDSLSQISERYLGYSLADLKTEVIDLKSAYTVSEAECETLIALAGKLSDYLDAAGLSISKWYGPSAAVNRLLSEWNVRREFKRITKENTTPMLMHAMECAFYGGRIETTKLGMVKGVFAYDLNSAFAYATMLLPQLTKGWRHTREYEPEQPFALWFVEYELPANSYIGLLPHRRGNGSIVYRRSGKGWYFSPEVNRLSNRYPDCFRVQYGYIVPYQPVTFAENIQRLYNVRLELINREGKGKGEKIFKMILQQFSGKFAQTKGEAPYLCLPWAGWIHSFARSQILEAIAGQEETVCYIHTDAVHTTQPLIAPRISENMGEWKTLYRPYGFYMAPGVHCFYNERGEIVKTATRGFENIDFADAIKQLNATGAATLKRQFFIGHQYASAFPGDGNLNGNYLQTIEQELRIEPRDTKSRKFPFTNFDWEKSYIDSRIIDFDDGRESAPRTEPDLRRRQNLMLEIARR